MKSAGKRVLASAVEGPGLPEGTYCPIDPWACSWFAYPPGAVVEFGGIPGVGWFVEEHPSIEGNLPTEHDRESINLSEDEAQNRKAVLRFLSVLARRRGRQLKIAGRRLWGKELANEDRDDSNGLIELLERAEAQFREVCWSHHPNGLAWLSDERLWELAALSLIVLHRVHPGTLGLPGRFAGVVGPEHDEFGRSPLERAADERASRWFGVGFQVLLQFSPGGQVTSNGPARGCHSRLQPCACLRPSLVP